MSYDLENIGDAFNDVLGEAAKKNEKKIRKVLKKAPNKFQRAAIAFYPKVLKQRSGNLIRSIQGFFSQNLSTKEYNLGLRAGGEVAKYARIQHEGGHTRPHIIRPRVAKALSWVKGGKRHFSKRVNHPGSNIKAKKYLIIPLRKEADKISKELLKVIGL